MGQDLLKFETGFFDDQIEMDFRTTDLHGSFGTFCRWHQNDAVHAGSNTVLVVICRQKTDLFLAHGSLLPEELLQNRATVFHHHATQNS